MTAAPETPRRSFDDMEGALAILREQGLRVSSARRLVLQSLFAADGPATAEAIAGRTGLTLDLASVYRNLETLERVGIVQHVHLGHGPGRYVLSTRSGGWTTCESCGTSTRIEPEALQQIRVVVTQFTGFDAGFGHFPIVGRCPACLST